MNLHCENVMNDFNYISYEMGFPTLVKQVIEFPMLDDNINTEVHGSNQDFLAENISHKENDRSSKVIETNKQQETMVGNRKFIYALL